MRGIPGGAGFGTPELHYQQAGGVGSFLIRRFLGSAVSNAAGYALGGAVQPALEPLTQDAANLAWTAHPVRPISLGSAAAALVRGFLTAGEAEDEAARSGFDSGRLATMAALASEPPAFEQLVSLRRREAISAGEFADGLAQIGYRPEWRGPLGALQNVLPSVQDLVLMAVREVFNPAQRSALDLDAEFPDAFAEQAARIGLSRAIAGQYWAAHWQLPSYEQLAAMLFRGELSAGSFSDALKALDYAPTWRGKLETIARPIPPLSDMIRFAVRDVYTPATVAKFGLNDDFPAVFAQEAALHGMEPPYPQQYWAAHWRLPSAIQGFRMLWRSIITPGELDVLLKALDYPPFWRTRLRDLAHIVPGRIDLKRMLRHDLKTPAQVKQGYIRLGYSDADAADMTAIAVAELESGDVAQKWAERARSRLYTVAHNEYLDGSIDDAKARELLGRVGATAAEAGTVLALWVAEGEIDRLELTPAQIKKAYKKEPPEGYTFDFALSELVERGMTLEDATTFLQT